MASLILPSFVGHFTEDKEGDKDTPNDTTNKAKSIFGIHVSPDGSRK